MTFCATLLLFVQVRVYVQSHAIEKWKAGDRYPTNAKLVLNALEGLARRRRIPKQRRYTKPREVAMTSNSIIPFRGSDTFDPSTPLPLHVARLWGFPLQYHQVEDKEYFSTKDWIVGLTGAPGVKARKMWLDTYKQWVDSIHLPYTVADKWGQDGIIQMDFTDDEGLYKIAGHLRVTQSRTALKAIKDFLAKAGVFVDEARRDPEGAAERMAIVRRTQALRAGKSEEWIATREYGIITRKQFVGQIYGLVQDKEHFGAIIGSLTNTVYRGVFHDGVRGLEERLGITPKENPRDHFSRIALLYTAIAEEASRIHLSQYGDNDFVPVPIIQRVVQLLAATIGVQADDLAKALQIDVVTGQRMLPGGEN